MSACRGAVGTASRTSSRSTATSPSSTRIATAAAQWPCLKGANAKLRVVSSQQLPVAELGGGAHAVVFSEASDADVCSWLPLARELVSDGFAVAMYDYTANPVANLKAVVQLERSHGAHTVAVVGASEGAKTSIVAASELRPAPNAVVSLSAEAALQGTEVAPYAARVHAPTLFVTAADDPYGADEAAPGFYRSEPATTKRLLVVPGTQHGAALLSNAKVHRAVTSFLATHDK
jgi:hypothetical protein